MSRYRLYPSPQQEVSLLRHCNDARYVWNLAVEQHAWWRKGRKSPPGYLEQSRQLTAAREANPWLAEGSYTIQQQSLRDFSNALSKFFGGTHGRPTWRKAGLDEGFRMVGVRGRQWGVRRLNRNWGEVRVPKAGWVRFRWSRHVPDGAKSYRIKRDRQGRWHVAFASIPEGVPAPGNGEVVGIDLGVTISATLSTREMFQIPCLSVREERRFKRLQRKLAKARPGSARRGVVKLQVARMHARGAARRKDWVEKTSTDIARRFDVIRVEDLKIAKMMRSAKGDLATPGKGVRAKAGLNRGLRRSGWATLVRRLEDKAAGRVEKIPAAHTSQRCSACGHVDAKSRESQAVFKCTACNFTLNADVNAAINIAAGHAVKARGGDRVAGPLNREPQFVPHSGCTEILCPSAQEDVKVMLPEATSGVARNAIPRALSTGLSLAASIVNS